MGFALRIYRLRFTALKVNSKAGVLRLAARTCRKCCVTMISDNLMLLTFCFPLLAERRLSQRGIHLVPSAPSAAYLPPSILNPPHEPTNQTQPMTTSQTKVAEPCTTDLDTAAFEISLRNEKAYRAPICLVCKYPRSRNDDLTQPTCEPCPAKAAKHLLG